jgi:hypothetical protein
MRIFKNKWFNHWASKEGISDAVLFNAAEESLREMLTLFLAAACSRNVCHGQGQENEAATVLLWDIKGQIRKESFFCTHLPRATRPTFQRRKKLL